MSSYGSTVKKYRKSNFGNRLRRSRSVGSAGQRSTAMDIAELVTNQLPGGRAVTQLARAYRSMKGSGSKSSSRSSASTGSQRGKARRAKIPRGPFAVGAGGPRRPMYTRGTYHGRFKPVRRVGPDMFRLKGVVNTTEIHGKVADPDCVYVGHSTYSGYQLLECVCMALLKKLFVKAGMKFASLREPVSGYFANTSDCWRITLYRYIHSTGLQDAITYDLPAGANTSIYQIVGDKSAGLTPLWPGLIDALGIYASGDFSTPNSSAGALANVTEPFSLHLYRQEGNTGIFWQHETQIRLQEEIVHCKSKSQLRVQNRTKSESGNADADDVANNPVIGKLYHFNGGAPRLKNIGVQLSSMLEPSGVLTARGNNLSPDFHEPPPATAFWNCYGQAGIKLEPGAIKFDTLYHYTSKPLLKFLKSMQYGIGNTVSSQQKQIYLFGKSSMLAIEDMINVNGVENINIAYECNREFGVYMTTKSKMPTIGIKYDISVNDLPPA